MKLFIFIALIFVAVYGQEEGGFDVSPNEELDIDLPEIIEPVIVEPIIDEPELEARKNDNENPIVFRDPIASKEPIDEPVDDAIKTRTNLDANKAINKKPTHAQEAPIKELTFSVQAPVKNPSSKPFIHPHSAIGAVLAGGQKLSTYLTAGLAAPHLLPLSMIALKAGSLPAVLATKGALVGSVIAKPILFSSALLGGKIAAGKAALVSVPVAIGTGVVAGAKYLRSHFDNSVAPSFVGTKPVEVPQDVHHLMPRVNVQHDLISPYVQVHKEVGVNSDDDVDVIEDIVNEGVVKELPEEGMENRRRKRSADTKVDTPILEFLRALRLLRSFNMSQCIARVVCQLSCDINAYGQRGRQVFENLLTLQTTKRGNDSDLQIYREAVTFGRRYSIGLRNGDELSCSKCAMKYLPCKATTDDLLAIASMIRVE